MKRALILTTLLLLTGCDTMRRNIESIDVQASYGGGTASTRVVLREPDQGFVK